VGRGSVILQGAAAARMEASRARRGAFGGEKESFEHDCPHVTYKNREAGEECNACSVCGGKERGGPPKPKDRCRGKGHVGFHVSHKGLGIRRVTLWGKEGVEFKPLLPEKGGWGEGGEVYHGRVNSGSTMAYREGGEVKSGPKSAGPS